MALSALAVENEKLNHKRPELQLLQWLGQGSVAPHGVAWGWAGVGGTGFRKAVQSC